jgi:hypothetical protein
MLKLELSRAWDKVQFQQYKIFLKQTIAELALNNNHSLTPVNQGA